MHLFGRRQIIHCSMCGKELGLHRYKPREEWGIEGMLCGNCHLEKTKDFILQLEEAPELCAICKKELSNENRNKPKWQWEMESGTVLCKSCYQKKDEDYNKKLNFCAICNCALGMFFYHPKPAWQVNGNLCRQCWDQQNSNNSKSER